MKKLMALEILMKQLIALVCLVLAASPPAMAQDKQAQQERMKYCDKQLIEKRLEGGERRRFMKACLAAGVPGAADPRKARQHSVTACSRQADNKRLQDDARKRFMSACTKS